MQRFYGAFQRSLIAADGSEALRVFRKHAAEIDLVLLDTIMPQLSGRAVSEEIRKDYPQLPVLLASGYSADTLHSSIRLEEDTTLIQKPYSPKELLHRIRDLLDQLRLEGGIPLPPWVAARGFDGAKPSTTGEWHFINGL